MAPLNKSSPKVSGIILSGGTSSRFQLKNEPWQDKALITHEGITLLEKTILSLMEFCNEIIVVVNSQDRLLTYQPIISAINPKGKPIIRFEVDNRNFRCSGPTLGLLSGLMHMTNNLGIVVPVDIPLLDSSILSELLSHLNNNSIVVPYWKSSGKIEPLLFSFKKQKVLKYIHFLGYIRRSRADDIFRTIPNSLFLAIASDKENLADKLFLSINDREKFVASIEIQSYSNYNIFDLGSSLSISSTITEDLLGSLTKFLKQNAFLTLTEDTIFRGLTLAETLMNAKMFFHAGILLNSMLELCSDLDLKNNESLVEKCLMAFSKEAERWKQLEISFLELHALTDAIKLPALKRDSREILKERITNLKKGMKLTKKNHSSKDFTNLLEEKVPGFLEKAKTIIQESEKAFNKEAPAYETNFLWDHSYRVGKIAYKLASLEGLDPFIPTVSALLHDAGKFNLGQYHKDDIPEEEHSATIAENLLRSEGLTNKEIKAVIEAISALYNDKLVCNMNCKIVHDADRLEKLGIMGISNFFTKMTLRNTNLTSAVSRNLSRELTYASLSPQTMFTKSARSLATIRSEKTIEFFHELLDEFNFFNLGRFFIQEFDIRNNIRVLMVVPENCAQCSGQYTISLSTKQGIKCEKLVAHYSCTKCNDSQTIEFCLPLLVKK